MIKDAPPPKVKVFGSSGTLRLTSSVFLLVMAIVLSLAACTTASSSNSGNDVFSFTSVDNAYSYAQSKGYKQAAALLSDGNVTLDEYRTAEATYRQCLERQGYQFGAVATDPVGGLRLVYLSGGTYQGPKGKADNVAINKCQDAYDPVEQSYTLTRPQQMNPQLLAAVKQCLKQSGVSYPASATNVKMLAGGASSPPASITTCVVMQSERLFPELPGVAIGY